MKLLDSRSFTIARVKPIRRHCFFIDRGWEMVRPRFLGLLFGLILIMSLYSFGPRTHLSSEVLASDSESANGLTNAHAWNHNVGADVASSGLTPEDDIPNMQGRTARSGIVGNVSVLLPGLECAGFTPAFPVKDTTSLVATSKTGAETLIPLWFTGSYNCVSFYDIFEARLPAGSYSLTLSYCSQSPPGPGCASLPTVVNIERRGLTFVSIDIVSCINCGPWNVTVKAYPLTPAEQHEFAFVCGPARFSPCTPLSSYLCLFDFNDVNGDDRTNCSYSTTSTSTPDNTTTITIYP